MINEEKPEWEAIHQLERLAKAVETLTSAVCDHGENPWLCEACWYWRGEAFRGKPRCSQ